jgi:endoglucanase
MNRRTFLKSSGVLGTMATTGLGIDTLLQSTSATKAYSSYNGFNLLAKFAAWDKPRKFNEQDFEIMAELGFDFARIPMTYWNWASKEDWFKIDEKILQDIDEVVELGKQYNIHINLNLHRLPGYCINGRDKEPFDLFDDTPENMQKALDGAVFHWKIFAKRYKGIPNERLTFDLINEPPFMDDESRYVQIVKALVEAIRQEDPQRVIVADGLNIGKTPVQGIVELGLIQSTRGYDPKAVSHYTATWVPKVEFETFNIPTWPLKDDKGRLWDKDYLREFLIEPWKLLMAKGIQVHVGEWGCYNKTPHDVALAWMRDMLALWKEVGWGNALWNLKGDFGILNSNRADVKYEDYKGHKLDRKMLELLKEFA